MAMAMVPTMLPLERSGTAGRWVLRHPSPPTPPRRPALRTASYERMVWPNRSSFRLQLHLLDNRPPLFDFGFLEGGESRRGPLIERGNLLTQIGQPPLHSRVGQCIHNGRIELGDDVLRRALGRP